MTRVEENKQFQEWFREQIGKTNSNYEEAKCDNLGIIASALMDISKSLAIMADKEKQDEKIDS